MKKGIIWGAGGTGRRIYSMLKEQMEVVCFVDCDETKWGKEYDGIKVFSPDKINKLEFDQVILGTLMGYEEVQEQLVRMGIDLTKFEKSYVEISVNARKMFLKRYAERVKKEKIMGSVGEAGVYRGEFAKIINACFNDRKCYLFDTFDGFDESDIEKEQLESLTEAEHLRETSEEYVYEKMPYKEKIIMKKGRFPFTTKGIDDTFCFVNLDMDLYQPTLEGLKFFYPKMVEGGIILIHDYFTEIYPNVEKAVDDFERLMDLKLHKMPIGDDISLAIIK